MLSFVKFSISYPIVKTNCFVTNFFSTKSSTNLGDTINLDSFTDSSMKMKNSSGTEISLGDIQNIGNVSNSKYIKLLINKL